MIKKQIIYKTYRHLSIRVLCDTYNNDRYDVKFTQSEYPSWSLSHNNIDEYGMKELLQIYTLRARLLQWLPPKITHWLVVGG